MRTSIVTLLENFDIIIEPTVVLGKPNETITIHHGDFLLSSIDSSTRIAGDVYFKWYPFPTVSFKGNVESEAKPFVSLSDDPELILEFNGVSFGKALITNVSYGDTKSIHGRILGQAVMGDGTIKVTEAHFSLPNVRDFFGNTVKKIGGEKSSLSRSRVTFSSDHWLIEIDKVQEFDSKHRELQLNGGFDFLYGGRVRMSKAGADVSELRAFLDSFSTFLSFLNGRRCSPMMFRGVHEGETIWFDYSACISDQFINVFSWPCAFSIDGLDGMWKVWRNLCKDELDRDFLITAVHWYLEANKQAGRVEGAIALIQNSLELLYNWLIVERRGIIRGSDATSLVASNKIRLLLNYLSVKFDVPETLENLTLYSQSLKEAIDGPECFVRIRNAIVHASEDKRKTLMEIGPNVRHEALELGLWYVELALMNILGFKGAYCNRTKSRNLGRGTNEEQVPWL